MIAGRVVVAADMAMLQRLLAAMRQVQHGYWRLTMIDILAVTTPLFALVAAGWLAAQRGLVPSAAIPGMNHYVLYLALPCMLARLVMNTPVSQLLHPGLLAAYGLAAVLMVSAATALALACRARLVDAAFGALVTAFPNSGFMGVPLLVAWLGPSAAGPVIGSLLVDFLFTSTLCVALSQARSGTGGMWHTAGRALRGALANPLPWAITLGAVLSIRQGHLPGPLDTLSRMLADSASPVALFTMGVVLWRPVPASGTAAPRRDVVPLAAMKLLLHPALVLACGTAMPLLGLALPAAELKVLVLSAALPGASNVALLTERYGADTGRVARIILVSTVLAFGSFSTLAWWLGTSR